MGEAFHFIAARDHLVAQVVQFQVGLQLAVCYTLLDFFQFVVAYSDQPHAVLPFLPVALHHRLVEAQWRFIGFGRHVGRQPEAQQGDLALFVGDAGFSCVQDWPIYVYFLCLLDLSHLHSYRVTAIQFKCHIFYRFGCPSQVVPDLVSQLRLVRGQDALNRERRLIHATVALVQRV